MALRKILTQGDPALEKVCRPVEKFNKRLHILLDDMRETLEESGGVGLAAPQVGILRRVVVVLDAEENMLELVNPVIVRQEGEQDGFEGCLSVPGMYGRVQRPGFVTVRAQDRDGNFFEASGEEMVARCFCSIPASEDQRQALEKLVATAKAKLAEEPENVMLAAHIEEAEELLGNEGVSSAAAGELIAELTQLTAAEEGNGGEGHGSGGNGGGGHGGH